ncbi:MAG: FAD-binding protein, partial [Alistipes sp.]|nr:FAD-binding protein [Alistipes sp.]
MSQEINLVLTPHEASDPQTYLPLLARKLGVSQEQIALARIVRRSVDARSRTIRVNLGIQVFIDGEQPPAPVHFEYPFVGGRIPVVVVGAGPAGLFAALRLIERGFCPIVVERGRDVSARKRDIAQIQRNGAVNPESNYAFGEGGAGTYSDGKLFTRSKKRGDFRKALEVFRFHGADESILYDAHPHIGTDRLPRIIAAMRQSVREAGGQILLEHRMTDLLLHEGRVTGIRL